MKKIYDKIKYHAIETASRYPEADFYRDFADQVDFSSHFFSTDAVV